MIDNITIEKYKREHIFTPLNSAEELRDWMYLYFDLYFPSGVVYPTSTHGPIEAMWRIYELFQTGQTVSVPQVVMVASRDSFKCSAKGTKILTKNSMKNIEDIKIGDEIWSGRNWKKVTDWIDDGHKKGIKITSSRGQSSTHSPIHRLWCLRDGQEQWIKMKDLNPSTDLVCVNLDIDNSGFVKNQEEYEIGYFLGVLMGDGTTTLLNKKGQVGVCTIDPYIKDFIYYFSNKFFDGNVRAKDNDPKRTPSYYLGRTRSLKLLREWGVGDEKSYAKKTPNFVWSSKSSMLGFLNGLFDTDGTFNSKQQVEIPITSEYLLKDIQLILNSFGVDSYFSSNKKKYNIQNHIVHRVYINSNNYNKLLSIGFENKSKKASEIRLPLMANAHDVLPVSQMGFVRDFLKDLKLILRNCKGKRKTKHRMSSHRLDMYQGITYHNIETFANWIEETIELNGCEDIKKAQEVLVRLRSILKNRWVSFTTQELDDVHFFDLTVEDDHSYWSNGFISHNTLSAAAIEVLIFIHFKLPMAHAAAIKFQAGACVQYVNSFFRKIRPYLEHHKWKKASDNKMFIEWLTEDGDEISLTVLTATKAGMNSRHVPLLVLDELDLMDPAAFKESRMVPSVYKGYAPLIVILSTRKFASGLMESQIKKTPEIGGELFRWNIIDVAEAIPHSVSRPDLPKEVRYLTSNLPSINISPEQFEALGDDERVKYDKFEAYAGIAKHPLLPVMRHYLADRNQEDTGFLYKPLQAVWNNFQVTDADFADAQLLSNKPTSAGLVYGRFEIDKNVLTPTQAMTQLTGVEHVNVTIEQLREFMLKLGVVFIGGGDYGFTDYTNIPILALIPNGEIWVVDNFFENGLEPDDIAQQMLELKEKWNVEKWFVEQAYPAYLKLFNRLGMQCPEFTKVVEDGIVAQKTKIVNSQGVRKFFVIKQPNTERVIQAYGEYRWATDSKGDIIEGKPYHDKEGVSDIMDSLRYPMQNLVDRKGKLLFKMSEKVAKPTLAQEVALHNQQLMSNHIGQLAPNAEFEKQQSQKSPKKRILWL